MGVGIVPRTPSQPARVSDIADLPDWLGEAIAPHAHAAGLVQSERASLDGVAWLEYSRIDQAGRLILSVFHLSRDRTITAEVWRPDRLRAAMRDGVVVATHQRTWRYAAETGPNEVRDEVVATISRWFA